MNTMQTSEAFDKIDALLLDQRDQAYANAKLQIAGEAPSKDGQPKEEDFLSVEHGKYPAWVSRTINGLTAGMLIASFLPSAMRLHNIALQLQQRVMQDAFSNHVAAICVVLSAEIGQVIFSLAAAITKSRLQRFGLYIGASICTLIALVGNIIAMENHIGENTFSILETVSPPILVLITAQILKMQMLHSIEQRHFARTRFEEAKRKWKENYDFEFKQWENVYANASENPKWDRVLANSIRNQIRQANKSKKAILRDLTDYDWRELVIRERRAEEWWDLQETKVAKQNDLQRSKSGGKATGEVLNAKASEQEGWFVRECPHCQIELKAKTELGATRSLSAHMKKHVNQQKQLQTSSWDRVSDGSIVQ